MKNQSGLNVSVQFHDAKTLASLSKLMKKIGVDMTKAMEDLTREVAESRTVVQSAVTLIRGFKAKLDAAMADQAKLQELSDSLDADANTLAAAVAENTDAQPEEPGTVDPI